MFFLLPEIFCMKKNQLHHKVWTLKMLTLWQMNFDFFFTKNGIFTKIYFIRLPQYLMICESYQDVTHGNRMQILSGLIRGTALFI